MLTRSIRQSISLMALCTVACAATVTATSSQRTMVSRQQIADAMQSAGFDTSAAQLQLLSNVTTFAGATLRVAKITRESADTVLAELSCHRRECLPFYVLVHDENLVKDGTIAARPAPASAPKMHPLIERGKPVTLLIENTNSRIVLPAVSAEAGMQGQIIKVTSPDRKRIYRAEVVSSTTVRSTL